MDRDDSLEHSSETLEGHEVAELQQVLEPKVGREAARVIARVARETHITASGHRGPLPRPEDFGQYEKILPGAAERILTMAEKEQSHRHEMVGEEARQTGEALRSDIAVIKRGQLFTFLVISAFAALAIYSAIVGRNNVALAAVIVALGTGFGSYILGRQPGAQVSESKPAQKPDLGEKTDTAETK